MDFPPHWVTSGKPRGNDSGGGGTKLEQCKSWLADKLADGPEDADTMERSASQKGYSETTRKRAMRDLGMQILSVDGVRIFRYKDSDPDSEEPPPRARSRTDPQENGCKPLEDKGISEGQVRVSLTLDDEDMAISQGQADPQENLCKPLENKEVKAIGSRVSQNTHPPREAVIEALPCGAWQGVCAEWCLYVSRL